MSAAPLQSVSIFTTVTVNDRAIPYATMSEAREQAARWVAEAIRFARSDEDFVVTYVGRTWRVGYWGSRLGVTERRRGVIRFWTSEEVRSAYAARWAR